jgi:hypothetical protein
LVDFVVLNNQYLLFSSKLKSYSIWLSYTLFVFIYSKQ